MDALLEVVPNDGGDALDVRALFQLQSQALKAALAQADASQTQIRALQAQIDALCGGPQPAAADGAGMV